MSLLNTEILPFKAQAYANGEFVELTEASLKGHWSVVFFYPADFTFVCPTELEDLAENYAEFKSLGVEVYAVSTDTHFTHKAWHESSAAVGKVQFPMIGDPTATLARNFQVLIEADGLAERGTFVINPEGKIVIMEHHDGGIGRDASELLRKVKAAQLAGTDQDTTDVKAFLKETITTDSDSGETAVVSDYVAQKTQETLETLAAVDARFKALGGELTAEQLSTADRYAQQMMDQYGDTYTANGIGLETVKAYERLQVEHTALLNMVYGPDGETPVEDDELTSHLDDSMYEICYISIPLYNTSTYAFADDDQKAEMLKLAQAAADSVNAAGGETVSDQVSALHEAAQNALPDIYAVLDGETSDDSASVQTELLTESDVASAFTQDGAADALRSLSYGEAAAVQINSSTLLLMVRVDPLSVSSLDDLRSQILSDMKGGELDDALAAGGAELAHDLDSSAMNKLPAKKIVNNSANS